MNIDNDIDIGSLNLYDVCRKMPMAEFVDLVSRLPYPVLKYLHSHLLMRIRDTERWSADPSRQADPEWQVRAANARRFLDYKAEAASDRLRIVEEFSLLKIAAKVGGTHLIRTNPEAREHFLLGLVERLVPPAALDRDEQVVLGICRSAAMPPQASHEHAT